MFDSISDISRLFKPDIVDIISREGSNSISESFLMLTRVQNSKSFNPLASKPAETGQT